MAGSPCGCLSIIAPLVLLIPHPGRAQPSNDAFADAQPLSVSAGSVTGSNVGATKEAGEPNHAGNPGGHSVWYRWTAPLSGSATIDTLGSDFDTLLGVYTGNSVSSLTTIASNDDISSTIWQSRVNFTAMAGATYQIAVDGWNGGAGNITLNWTQNLPDLIIWGPSISPRIETVTFSSTSCAVVEGLVQAGTRKLLRFSTETRNQGTADIFLGNPATNPQFVWAPCHGHYHFNNYANYQLLDSNGQSVATGLKIGFCLLDSIRWDANAPSSARYNCGNQGIQQGWGDVYYSTLDGQWIDITGVPDGNYTLEMEVNPQHILPESNYANNITRTPITIGNVPPANDNFVDAGGLSGSSASVSGSNVGATKEAGEPNHAGNAGGHSVWYVWTAPSGARAVVDTIGSGFDTLLAVYTGKSVSALTAVASNDDISSTIWQSRVTLNPLAGTTYYIAVDGWNGATGNIVLTLDQSVANDNFTNCEFIGGANGTVTGSNVGATKEAGEPNHAGNPGGHSIWYCWTAPDTASVSFDTVGSTFDTLLAVYVGNSVDGLAAVASNDDIDSANLQSRVTFTAVATTQYHIAIDGYNGASGNTTLNYSQPAPTLGLVLGANSTSSPAKEVDVWGERPTLSYNLLAAGEYELTITGQPLRSYTVEVSYDLIRWTPLATTLADLAGAAYFRDKATMPAHRESPGNSGAGPIQGGPGDPVCDVSSRSAFAGAAGPAKGRFYRVVEAP